jgi:hypothetical protein
MPNDKAKKHYEERLAVCKHNVAKHNADSYYWILAVEVYEHLIQCPLRHSLPNITCQWQSGD